MTDVESFMDWVAERNPGQPEFLQAVHDVAGKLVPFVRDRPRYAKAKILERLSEPDRILIFRVTWEDDAGELHINRGFRIQHSNAIGPYKGGLRFDESVNLSVLKFLAFEQVFKNSLTTLPMGGAKGGSDFHPKGKSEHEVMRFCQAFMTELHRHIGPSVDVPAGDIGVGTREIGFLFGMYKRLENQWSGAITGKGASYGGSLIRTEATGYGCVYFAREMLRAQGEDIAGMGCVVSGSGNVAQYAAEKLLDLDAKVLALSDRTGFLHFKDGLERDQLLEIIDLKTNGGNLDTMARASGIDFCRGLKPWIVPCDAAFPCATQNEITATDARTLIDHGCRLVAEGANMPATTEAVQTFEEVRTLYGPGKAANAGGVSISGLEMTQNAIHLSWTRDDVDLRLQDIMRSIHDQCAEYGRTDSGWIDYVAGANIAGFVKVADAMLAFGIV
ncbi:MAG TPA: NADP-specific glutamate dehydrogenase [Longimicrobiales bacterium]|nr:NADP-specific glutamate dehydrogenase [Longimicrobiales bacterium]